MIGGDTRHIQVLCFMCVQYYSGMPFLVGFLAADVLIRDNYVDSHKVADYTGASTCEAHYANSHVRYASSPVRFVM